MTKRNINLLFTILITVIILVGCQAAKSIKSVQPEKDQDYPGGASYTKANSPGPVDIAKLKSDLKHYSFDTAVKDYFGNRINDGSLPDIVCYIDKHDSVYIGMAHAMDRNCKEKSTDKRPVLWGKTRAWVLVFSDSSLNYKTIQRTNLDSSQYARLTDSISKLANRGTSFNPWISSVTPYPSKIYSLVINCPVTKTKDSLTIKQLTDLTSSMASNSIIKSVIPENHYVVSSTKDKKVKYTDTNKNNLISAHKDINKDSIKLDKVTYKLTVLNNPNIKVIDGLDSATSTNMKIRMIDSIKKYDGNVLIISRPRKTYNVVYNVPQYVIKRQALDYLQQPGQLSLANIINTISSIFIKAPLPTVSQPGNPLQDSSATFSSVVKITSASVAKKGSTSTNADTIYAGMVSFNIALNTKNRIVIAPSDQSTINTISYNFGNFETTYVTAGLGVGINYNPFADPKLAVFDKHIGLSGRHPRQPDNDGFTKFYVFGHYYFSRPELPIDKCSWALVLGTNISTTNPLQDLVFGVRWGFEHFGITVAENYMVYDDQARGMNTFFALDYQL